MQENKISTTPVNAILGGVSMGLSVLTNFSGCLQDFTVGIGSGFMEDTTNSAKAKYTFSVLILIPAILSFINLRVKSKILQIITIILYAITGIIAISIELLLDAMINMDYWDEISPSLILMDFILVLIGLGFSALSLIPIIKKKEI